MVAWNVVLDTNVFISALRSTRGASYAILSQIGRSKRFQIHLSVPLVLEYEEVAKRQSRVIGLNHQDISDAVDYLCSTAVHHDVHFLWRPCLRDPNDDMVLELSVSGNCDFIVMHNTRDFSGCEQFGIRAVKPQEFLAVLGTTT